jgi:apolipoprotein N-acyltransferase
MSQFKNRFLLSALSALSGILLWLAWPDHGYTPLIFIAFVPLLFVEHVYSRNKTKNNGWKIFGNFYLGMLLWNALTTWWIYYSSPEGSFVAIGLNSFFMAIVWYLFYRVKKSQGPVPGYFSLIFFWVAFEYLHLNWEITWPWLTLGNSMATHPEWIQWYQYTGALGGSVWILMINLLVFQLAKNFWYRDLLLRLRKINILLLSFLIFVLLAGPTIYSLYEYYDYKDKGKPTEVVVVQPNIDPYNEKFNGSGPDQLAKILRLASTVIDTSTEFIIAPETAIPEGLWEDRIEAERPIETIRKYIDGYPKINVIIGLTTFKAYEDSTKRSITARKLGGRNEYCDVYNAAMMLSEAQPVQLYRKSKLVPGVEKMPYPKIFGFLENYAIELGGTSGSLGTQQYRTNFVTIDGSKVAPAICYESIYGDFMSGYIRDSAQFISVITNDGWWQDTPGYRQHMNYARILAVEFRKSVARSANTGISCFINQRGDVISKTDWWVDDAIKGTVYRNFNITFYARHGDYIGFICAFMTCSILLYFGFKRILTLF